MKTEVKAWAPWAEFAVEPENVLPIEAPPCAGCAHWRPVRQFVTALDKTLMYKGVRLCHGAEMNRDFSCFESKGAGEPKPACDAKASDVAPTPAPMTTPPAAEPKQRRKRRTPEEMAAARAAAELVPKRKWTRRTPAATEATPPDAAPETQKKRGRVPKEVIGLDGNTLPSESRKVIPCEHPGATCQGGCPCVCRPCLDVFLERE